MKQLNAYLRFDGNCREAMSFYQECLGGDHIPVDTEVFRYRRARVYAEPRRHNLNVPVPMTFTIMHHQCNDVGQRSAGCRGVVPALLAVSFAGALLSTSIGAAAEPAASPPAHPEGS